jgi:ABC-type multidrug transport system permease subunit
MFRVLLAKDLRRAWRNPVPWLVNLALPLCITALIGLTFGGYIESDQIGRIKFAFVDEDNSPATTYLRGYLTATTGQAAEHLEPLFVNRETALQLINNNEISSVFIIPANFTIDYLTGRKSVALELIKNPTESIHPAVLEELLGTVVTGMNVASRYFQFEQPEWKAAVQKGADPRQILELIERAGQRAQMARQYISSPLIGLEKNGSTGKTKSNTSESGTDGGFNLFAYILIGMTGMYLLFLAGSGMMDLQRELRIRTFERYQTLRQRTWAFLLSKVVFAGALVLFGSFVLLAGGGLIFHIHWPQPLALAALMCAYASFAAGLMALLAVLAPDERQANSFNYIVALSLSIPGGCMFPAGALPDFMRHHITPFMPTAWFADTARELSYGNAKFTWILVSFKLVLLSVVLIGAAAFFLRRRLKTGART